METLDEAREFIADGMFTPGGVPCPCCEQNVKLYPRKLNSGMASMLLYIWRATQEGHGPWIHVSHHFLEQKKNAVAQEYSKLRFWGLLEEQVDGAGKRVPGVWRITDKGIDFAEDRITVPRTAFVFNNKVWAMSEDTTDIKTALGDKFDYDELMGYK